MFIIHFPILENFETELRGLGLETTEDLKEVMKLGYFKCFWNRVYIVGPYFSGKSCLAKLLVGDALPKERKSTDGIWIYMGRAGMDLNDGKWIFIPKGEVVQEILMSMIMTLSKTESLDTENQTASLDEPEKNIIRRPVSIKNDHEEVVIFENSPQGFVHKEIISQVHRRESLGAHDNTFTACISEENSNICDTANETKMLNVISADIRTPVVPSKNELDGQNAKKRTPLERISKTHIVPDTESNALGIFVAAPNTPRLFPEESKISDVEELESSPSEIFLKEISTSEFRLVESIAEYPKIDGKKTTNPVREKYKEKLIKEVANELSHNKLHEMVISSIREGKYKQSIVPIDIWDFGGQKDYYMTHQLFITSRGIFVLVFNGSLNLHKHMPDLSFLPGHLGKPTIAGEVMFHSNKVML
ncbi:unnamed protein product [Mytilus coruscus]|uniref:Uncharacterized protein n=1 Tax=Mytilus coruscus TaxID=42192 RepID=A0A6J8A541_MYTCO|nr:unnamed protein product [Mytilus coruscus]